MEDEVEEEGDFLEKVTPDILKEVVKGEKENSGLKTTPDQMSRGLLISQKDYRLGSGRIRQCHNHRVGP